MSAERDETIVNNTYIVQAKADNKTISYNDQDELQVINIPEESIIDKKVPGYETYHREVYNFGDISTINVVKCEDSGSLIVQEKRFGDNMLKDIVSIDYNYQDNNLQRRLLYGYMSNSEYLEYVMKYDVNTFSVGTSDSGVGMRLEGESVGIHLTGKSAGLSLTGEEANLSVNGKEVVRSINGVLADESGELPLELNVLTSADGTKFKLMVSNEGFLGVQKIQ
ncbi:hypothetical protein [Myroides odoratimimus]|uniref:hypothetical protein n=1 Tax=Myroides odoratimimus TaxID=76832 RepID=UPI0025757309|nr:hypothetical protein [Myroides odoratimimus]